ncbi:unnamed protein product [Schistosoma mattheei]|uniref:Kinesin-like protein n=1 Tax=Schistosoma mattheei TaxID=31246 RepID=A0A183PZB9_9TREM|nr:unnamed protein product [Schistosoma mattheei]
MVEGFRLSSINCNLLADFESCTRDAQTVLSCPDKCTVIACPPEIDGPKHSFRNLQKSANKFTFNEVFRQSDTQGKVFEIVAADKIRAFIEGLNGLIFAYGTTSSGKTYTLQGVKWYPVSSPEEALRLLAVGRHCQKVASTRLNQASSRSHSILCVKAVRVVDKNNPNFARVSTLMFCDLAGSERSVKAATGGQTLRIREAGNINSSLLTLGRCIECLRYNQVHPDNPKLVPYRDSKLTRLFQGFFTGQGRACMIVNASPNPELFDETLHALRFAALARQVIVEVNPVPETSVLHPNKVKCKQRVQDIKQIKSSNQPIVNKYISFKHKFLSFLY